MIQLPPPLRTSEPGSFARRTFAERIPKMVDDIIAWNDYPPRIVRALRALKKEIVSGKICALKENADDREFWNAHAAEYIGKSWLDVPWYWADTYFYRRVLQAVEYFQPGEFYQRDPYAQPKHSELAPDKAPHALSLVLASMPADQTSAFNILMHASLWGNRTDLSLLEVKRDTLPLEQERANILIDDTPRAWEHLQATRGGDVDFICDNAGTELFFDLALADFLLRADIAKRVTFHVKPQPFFVSDTMTKDVMESLDTIGQSSAPELRHDGASIVQCEASSQGRSITRRLATWMSNGRFILSDHPFWVTGFFFRSMPDDLRAVLARAALVISKGDANYRRLVGDCHWQPTTSVASIVDYFPAPIVALRTLKAELIVGLRDGEAERLSALDPTWRVNGKRGVVQFYSPQ
jgi:uncharacterized protein with ATP-grasp and redox domains